MAMDAVVLFVDRVGARLATRAGDGWAIESIAAGVPDAQPQAIAQSVAGALKARQHRDASVLLAIPSDWCLVTPLALDDRERSHPSRSTLALRLEEHLPLAAEEFVADFVYYGERALGIAGRTALLKPLVDALEAEGLAIGAIVPKALLALQDWAADAPTRSRWPSAQTAVVAWQDGDAIDVMWTADGKLAGWSVVPADPSALTVEMRRLQLSQPVAQVHCCAGGAIAEAFGSAAGDGAVVPFERDMTRSAADAAAGVLAGTDEPIVDLRRGALAPGDALGPTRAALNAALLAAALFAVVLAVTLFIRTARYSSASAAGEEEQVSLFRQVYPNSTPPMNVKARLEAEYRSMAPPAGRPPAATPRAAHGARPALVALSDLLGRLPPGLKLDLSRAEVDGDSFRLEGVVASPEDVQSITDAIRAESSIQPSPPATQPTPDGRCAFSIGNTSSVETAPMGGGGRP